MDETSTLRWLVEHLWVLLGPIVGWVWNKQDARINHLEDSMYTQEDARERRDSVDKALEDRRQDVIQLHTKIDSRAERLNDKMDKLAHDMNEGSGSIRDLLIGMKK